MFVSLLVILCWINPRWLVLWVRICHTNEYVTLSLAKTVNGPKPIRVFGGLLYDGYYENMPIQIYWKFFNQKKWKFQIKNSDILHISAQNIDCGYSLEPPQRGGSNEYPQSMFSEQK